MVAGFKQKMAEVLVTFVRNLTLTSYVLLDINEDAILVYGNMADTRGNFIPNFLLFWILALQPFSIFSNLAANALILN